jgi:indole-3-glycerol phosphate synthase
MILDRIIETKRQEVQDLYLTTSVQELLTVARASAKAIQIQPILQEYRDQKEVAIIAEVKKASPSKGLIRADFDPVEIAKTYERCGAAMVSVLTDRDYFQGSLSYLQRIRQHVSLPLLRKDFIIDEIQIVEARASGADLVLLIAACLDDSKLRYLHDVVRELGMTALVEVHTEQELERALRIDPILLGINNRDLHTFQVNRQTTQRIASKVPSSLFLVSESGIESHEHIQEVQAYGAAAVLVGESLMRADDIGTALHKLRGVYQP